MFAVFLSCYALPRRWWAGTESSCAPSSLPSTSAFPLSLRLPTATPLRLLSRYNYLSSTRLPGQCQGVTPPRLLCDTSISSSPLAYPAHMRSCNPPVHHSIPSPTAQLEPLLSYLQYPIPTVDNDAAGGESPHWYPGVAVVCEQRKKKNHPYFSSGKENDATMACSQMKAQMRQTFGRDYRSVKSRAKANVRELGYHVVFSADYRIVNVYHAADLTASSRTIWNCS